MNLALSLALRIVHNHGIRTIPPPKVPEIGRVWSNAPAHLRDSEPYRRLARVLSRRVVGADARTVAYCTEGTPLGEPRVITLKSWNAWVRRTGAR